MFKSIQEAKDCWLPNGAEVLTDHTYFGGGGTLVYIASDDEGKRLVIMRIFQIGDRWHVSIDLERDVDDL